MDYAKREEKILRLWKNERTFEASVRRRRGKPRFVFYEGPPTANGRPGIHHVLVRAIKDAFLRYKTMRGFLVERRAGWDTHGLPVEIEVEKELGLQSKQDIERYGIGRFNAKAKQSVWRFKDDWEHLTERIGFWIDQEHPYVTYENDYIEAVWRILKTIASGGLLEEDLKVVPLCTRCGTALSSHEVALGYQSVTENSVYVKFRVADESDTFFLGWTTTPWTLPGNVALAVGADIDYVKVLSRQHGETYILAKAALSRLGLQDDPVIGEMKGVALSGTPYEPLFHIPETRNAASHRVYVADFVNTEEGTGIVHTAVMYGEDDYHLGARVGLPKVHTVDEHGRFVSFVPDGLAGKPVKAKETESAIIALLRQRGLLLREEAYTHDYPFCWRCGTPLLYYAKRSWFIRISKLRDALVAENENIRWVPDHLREGRFGEWLREIKDWAISRERYWGTPLPIWRCERNAMHTTVLGSRAELARYGKPRNRYFIVRHGHATHNEKGTISCYPEKRPVHLTPRGKMQIRRVAETLKREHIDLIFASDLARTKETAEIIGKAIGVRPRLDRRLREYNVGSFNGKTIAEYRAFLGSPPAQWTKRAQGGETWRDVRKRMMAFLRDCEQRYEGKTILIVSHGDPLFVLKGAVRGLGEEHYFSGKLSYPKIGAFEPLRVAALPYGEDGTVDLHRPWTDDIRIACPKCGGMMRRVPEVLDVWFDSGAMPWASQSTTNKRQPQMYPADFICEAIDQTRGWFYTLLAVATLLGKPSPYRTVLCTGHVLDKSGKKMSKSKGNIVDPWAVVGKYGADAVRWYFFSVNQPWNPKRFDEQDVRLAQNRFIGTLYNVFQFWKTYSAQPSTASYSRTLQPPTAVLDRWIVSRLNGTIATVRERMDAYDITAAVRAIDTFVVDDFSNWYVRRSRDRFQKPSSPDDLASASAFLGNLLAETAKLSAPFIPFLAEAVYRGVGSSSSVHVQDFPVDDPKLRDAAIEAAMASVRRVAALALAQRKAVGISVRQPLATLDVVGTDALDERFLQLIADETNVKTVRVVSALASPDRSDGAIAIRLDTTLTPSLQAEGWVREFIRAVQELRKDAKLTPEDHIIVRWHGSEGAVEEVIENAIDEIRLAVRAKRVEHGPKRTREKHIAERELQLGGESVWIGIYAA